MVNKESNEERQIRIYLEELKENGYIDKIIYQPDSFKLFDSVPKRFYKNKIVKNKIKQSYTKRSNILNEHIYTPDFKIYWNEKAKDIFEQDIDSKLGINLDIPFISNSWNDINSYLEVKGSFDRNNMTRMFLTHIQPFIYWQYREYIQLIKPIELFKKTFIPKKLLNEMFYKKDVLKNGIRVKKNGDKKFNFEYRTLEQYIK